MADRIQFRRDTAARWAQYNPILLEGELGIETDTKLRKVGDGSTAWNNLEYLAAENIVQGIGDSENAVMSQKAVTEMAGLDEYPVFSESTAYSAGDVVNYNGKLYKFTADHAAGVWSGTDVEETDVVKAHIVQELGDSETAVMSQKTTTNEINKLTAIDDNKKHVKVGKNLFDKSTAIQGYWINSNGTIITSDQFYLSAYIEVEPNTQYYVSSTSVGGAYHVFYDKEMNVVGSMRDGTITTPNNAKYIRLSVGVEGIDTAQMELGSSKTSYEPYTDNYDNEQKFAQLSASLEETNKQLSLAEGRIPETVVGKNLFDPDKVVSGFLYVVGLVANNDVYVTSDYISVEGGQTVTAHPLGTGPIYFCQYNADKELVTSTKNSQTLTVTLESNTAYIRATFLAENYATEGQIEYGSSATEYEPYHLVIADDWLPEDIGNGTTPDEVKQIIAEEVFPMKIILPSKLYFKVGRQNNLYFKQAVKCSPFDNFEFEILKKNLGLRVYERQLSGTPSSAVSDNNRFTLRKFGRKLQESTVQFNAIDSPSSAKSVKILNSGDSISDLGGWQAALKELLEADNVTVKYIGTMINRANIGTSQSPNYAEDIWGEVLSGGNMSFITEYGGAAKILTVSNITELPKTGYPGTAYLDPNNNNWVVRGFKLTRGGDGKYSGKLKLGKFKADPNYGDGATDNTSEVGNFPAIGTITKTASENGSTLAGDETIAYTSFDDARFNPFWNPTTDELDFQYYFDYWGFDAPDIFIMQWGYNEVQSYEDVDSESVQTAKSRAKQIVDKFHSQYPNTKFIFGLECYGREAVTYSGGSSNNNAAKKYSVLSFAEEIISLFEGNDDAGTPYSNYVTLVPVYAMMDHVYGYGALTERNLCDLYSNAKTTVGQNGKDGVHPSYFDGGLREIGRAYEPAVLALI